MYFLECITMCDPNFLLMPTDRHFITQLPAINDYTEWYDDSHVIQCLPTVPYLSSNVTEEKKNEEPYLN